VRQTANRTFQIEKPTVPTGGTTIFFQQPDILYKPSKVILRNTLNEVNKLRQQD
jgi:hypothetical protein